MMGLEWNGPVVHCCVWNEDDEENVWEPVAFVVVYGNGNLNVA